MGDICILMLLFGMTGDYFQNRCKTEKVPKCYVSIDKIRGISALTLGWETRPT